MPHVLFNVHITLTLSSYLYGIYSFKYLILTSCVQTNVKSKLNILPGRNPWKELPHKRSETLEAMFARDGPKWLHSNWSKKARKLFKHESFSVLFLGTFFGF